MTLDSIRISCDVLRKINAPVMTIGQLEDELCLVGADSMTVAMEKSNPSLLVMLPKKGNFNLSKSLQCTVADHGGQTFWKQYVRF